MAHHAYFADLSTGETLEWRDSVKGGQLQGAQGIRYIDDRNILGFDGTQWVKVTRKIVMKSSPSRHECDSRCFNATGRTMQCECACGGKNHGKGSALTCAA